MSTRDVPGHKKINNDELAMGCWAEHDDGSLVFVESTESGRVIYSMFDLSQKPIIEYRDAMPEKGFKDYFSFSKKKDIIWTWHDKTPFPWNRIIKEGAKDGVRYACASDQISAAAKVSKSLKVKGKKLTKKQKKKKEHLIEKQVTGAQVAKRILKGIQKELSKLGI